MCAARFFPLQALEEPLGHSLVDQIIMGFAVAIDLAAGLPSALDERVPNSFPDRALRSYVSREMPPPDVRVQHCARTKGE